MAGSFHRIWCDECGVEITWLPVVIDHRTYCCHDCAVGLECDCGPTSNLWEDDTTHLWTEGIENSPEPRYGIDYGTS